MSIYLSDVSADIAAGIVAAIPEIQFTVELEQMEIINFADVAGQMPFAVYQFSRATRAENSPTACRYYNTDLTVTIVADANNNPDVTRPYMERLRDWMDQVGFDLAQVLSVPELDQSETAGANRMFIQKGYSQRGGSVSARLLFGDGPL